MRCKKGFGRKAQPGEYAAFSLVKKPTQCCGLISVQSVIMGYEGEANMLSLLNSNIKESTGLPDKYLGYIATLREKDNLKVAAFHKFGFETIKKFRNPNTGNVVLILFYKNEDYQGA